MFKMLRRLLGEQITFEYSGKDGLPLIEADPGMIEQVVLNLCVNARDAMPKGGRLRVGTDFVELAASQLTRSPGARPGKYVRLIVTDNGCGMDELTQQRIFEPFFTTKEAGKGTGLGLATVHGIVSQHRGWVEVVSAPGQGTTFSVILPATDKIAEVESRTEASQPIARGTETILLVEDEPGVRLTIGQFLRRTGYNVLEAANGVEAITLWRQHRPGIHLLFTDMVMPEGMTGLELAERLLAEKADLKVIITSGYSADLLNLGKLAAGILYLPKPTPPARLAAAVRECLDAKPK
jgi:CheY-like chemotaxis protein